MLVASTPVPTPSTVPDEYDVTPGLLGFLVIVAVGLALWVLLRSLSHHLGRIQVPHDERHPRRGFAGRTYAPVVAQRDPGEATRRAPGRRDAVDDRPDDGRDDGGPGPRGG